VQLFVERPKDNPHAALTDGLQHLVMPQPAEGARPLRRSQEVERFAGCGLVYRRLTGDPLGAVCPRAGRGQRGQVRRLRDRPFEEATDLRVCGEEAFDPAAQVLVPGARLVQEGGALGSAGAFQGSKEDRFQGGPFGHAHAPGTARVWGRGSQCNC
jgi:hypothetical protein